MAEHGSHEDFAREEAVEGSTDRGFGFVFAGLFAIIGGFAAWRGGLWWPWIAAAAALLAIALVYARVLAPFNRAWTWFAVLLYKVMSPITMGAVFFLVVTPIGLFMRWRGKDLLRLKREPEAKSYWIERTPPGPAPETMRNQY